MAISLTTTKDAAKLNGLKVLVYGNAGAGKTTLCKTMPGNPIVISAESGLLSLRDVDIPVIQVSTLQEVGEAYDYLVNHPEYDWIALDSISEIAEVVLAHAKKESKDPRKAYGDLQDKMMELLRHFRDLPGRNIYMACKMERIKEESSGIMLYAPLMPGSKLAQQIPYLFDEVLALVVEKDEEGISHRYLKTTTDYTYVAKDRSGKLHPDGEPADLSIIFNKITGAH